MANKRVVIALNTAWNLYNFRAGLIRALVAEGYEVVAVAPPDDYVPRLAELGCRYVPLPMDNQGTSPLRDLLLLARFWRLFRRERPMAFLGYTVKPNVYGSLAAHSLGIPVVNNIAGLGTAFIQGGWMQRMVKALYRLALGRSARVFFQNPEDRSLFVQDALVKYEKSALLPGSGLDLRRYTPQPVKSADGGRPLCFLLVARLLWDKGVGEFVEAARLVKEQFPETRIQLLGFLGVENRTAIPKETVEKWVQECVIEYLGGTDDVRPFLTAADCVVLPSYREGTPRTLLEASATARPIIATDVPGCREVVDEGENGLLCRVRDAKDLAAKMMAVINMAPEARVAMGRKGREKVEREFDERIVIDAYLRELEAIDGRHPSPESLGHGGHRRVTDRAERLEEESV